MRKSSKDKYANQQRRQSPRLSGRNAIREEEDGESIDLYSQEQHSVNNYIVKQLKFEMQEPEDVSVCKSSEHIDVVGDSGSDELTIIDITLKDLQQKCKAKRRKGRKGAASSLDHSSHSDSDQSPVHHDHVKVKEESDLEEPLIILKRKITKTSTREREHRKRACVGPLMAEKDDSILFEPSECSPKVGFFPITTETASTHHELSDHAAPVLELNEFQDQNLMETVNSVACSMDAKRILGSDNPELSYHIKSEIVETYSLKQHAKDSSSTVGLSLGISGASKLVGNSLSEQIHEVSKEWPEMQQKAFISFDDSDHCLSASKEVSMLSVSELNNGIHVDGHFTYSVKSELSNETSQQEYTSPYVDSAEGFIEKFYHSEEAMTDLHYSADANLPDNEELSSARCTSTFYLVDDNCTEHEELNESLPIIDEDALEIKKVSLSSLREESSQLPASMSDSHKCGSNKNHDLPLEDSANESTVNDIESHGDSIYKRMTTESCTLNMISGSFRDSMNNMPLREVAICSQGSEMDSNCNLPCEEVYGLEEIFLSSKDKLNGAAEIVTCCSNELSNFPDAMGLTEKPEVQPSISSSGITVPNDEQCTGTNLVKATEDSCPFSEEKLNNTLDQLVCNEKFYLVNSLGKRQAENDQGLIECRSPKKLLSNRQTISPSSQERLCWALNDIYLHNGNQITGQSDAAYLLSPKKTNKKRRNDSEGPLSPVKKVNLKSSNTSCRSSCSCSKSSLTMHMEKAILFAQRQMHDIEKLSTQLLKGLNSMRNIVEETLNSDVHHFMASKFTADEINAANENALELERTTKKWLTIMTKDCNRFCKIMKVAGNKTAVPVNGACRQRRKITFADEVGGVLCQVKVFERQQSPDITPESQQAS